MDASSVPLPPSAWGTAVYLITFAQRQLVPLVRHYYPDAQERTVENSFDDTVFWSFRIDPTRLAAHRTLRRSASSAGDAGTWRGSFFIGETGHYSLRAAGRSMRLDGAAAAVLYEGWLATGWHALTIAADTDDTAPAALEWILPGATSWTRVPPESFSDHVTTHGLLGRYFAAVHDTSGPEPIDAIPDVERIETALSFDWLTPWDNAPPAPVAAATSTMEWVGSVARGEDEVSALRLTSSSAARLYLDGELVAEAAGGFPPQVVEVTTSQRKRAELLLRVTRNEPRPEPWVLTLEWRQPGGGWSAFARYTPAAATPPR